MKYDVTVVANWFLNKESMTHKKLQKLCYYAQAWSYALYNRPIIDDVFEAWVHGPVSPKLYSKYKYSYMNRLTPEPNCPVINDEDDINLLESVWLTYGGESANSLEALTHTERPWQEARNGYSSFEPSNVPISKEVMTDYYRSIYLGSDE